MRRDYRRLLCPRCGIETRHSRPALNPNEVVSEGLSLNVGAIEEALRQPWRCTICRHLTPWWDVPED